MKDDDNTSNDQAGPNWPDITTIRDPAWRAPAEDELRTLHTRVHEAAAELAARISVREEEHRTAGQTPPDAVVMSGDWQLAYLHALRHMQRAVDAEAARAAKAAGGAGAGYPQLGDAWEITKQGARKKWPGVVDTSGGHEDVDLRMYGGHVSVCYLADESVWWWLGSGADGTYEEAEGRYESQPEAIVAAGVFLKEHSADEGAGART